MIYKLKYGNRDEAKSSLIENGVIDEAENYLDGTHAVVWIGKLIDQAGEYDEEGNEIKAPTFIEGYHVDIMVDRVIDFGSNALSPNNPKHNFAGH